MLGLLLTSLCRLINCAFLVVPVPKMKSLVYIKVVVYFGAAFAMLGWTVSLAGGSLKSINAPSEIKGTEKDYLIFKFLFLGLASCGTFISNASDLQRYATKPNDVLIGQFVSFPLSNFLVAVLGNLIASASKAIFGEVGYIESLVKRSYRLTKLSSSSGTR